VLQNAELVAVVTVQSIAGGYPDKAVAILEYLRRETARHLLVGIKRLTHLGMCAQEEKGNEKQERKTPIYCPMCKKCMFHVL
jgi:methyl coenzyme M reductase subunit C-like uncharacterized protein (methanogenesis marker protein 7)